MGQRSVVPDHGFAGSGPLGAVESLPDGRLRKVLQLIESLPVQSVHELAREVGLSRAHLERLFKREMGTHLSGAISEKRFRRAQDLLVHTDLEIKEIADAVGYRHHSSFVRAFRRQAGETPKHYRQRKQS